VCKGTKYLFRLKQAVFAAPVERFQRAAAMDSNQLRSYRRKIEKSAALSVHAHQRSKIQVFLRPPYQGNEIRPSVSIGAAAAGRRRVIFVSFLALVELRQVAGDDGAVHRPGITTADE